MTPKNMGTKKTGEFDANLNLKKYPEKSFRQKTPKVVETEKLKI
jgi:hypothetical protein